MCKNQPHKNDLQLLHLNLLPVIILRWHPLSVHAPFEFLRMRKEERYLMLDLN